MNGLAVSAYKQRLEQAALRSRTPLNCLFEITPTCNLRCGFCYVALDPYKGPYLSTAEACRVIDIIADAGVLWLTLTGGEIFSRRDFTEIYRHARSRGLLVTLFTNATLVTEKIAAVLRAEPPDAIEVSIYGADAEHYERVTGIPGSFARFVRGVDLLRTVPTRMLLKHPTSTMTEHHVDAIREWCTQRGLAHTFSFEVENRHDGGQAPAVYRIESKRVKALTDHVRGVRGVPRQSAPPLPECSVGDASANAERLYKCGAGRLGFFVDGLGNASHCVLDRDPAFPLLDRPWEEIWSAIGSWVNQPLPADAPCSGCSLRGGCHNCPARSRLATGSPYLKDTYHCDVTHAAHGLPPALHTDPRLTAARPLGACAR